MKNSLDTAFDEGKRGRKRNRNSGKPAIRELKQGIGKKIATRTNEKRQAHP